MAAERICSDPVIEIEFAHIIGTKFNKQGASNLDRPDPLLEEHLEQTHNRSHWGLKMSDHKAVTRLFEAGIKVTKSIDEKMAEEIGHIKAEVKNLKELLGAINEKLDILLCNNDTVKNYDNAVV